VLTRWIGLGLVPRVGRSFVTTRPWQARVGILVCGFGAYAEFILREEFLSAPIHSPPLSGRLIGPSIGIRAGCGFLWL
jgi:hypothetical protein